MEPESTHLFNLVLILFKKQNLFLNLTFSYGADKSPPKPKPPMWGVELNAAEEIYENWERLARRCDAYIASIRPDKPKKPKKPRRKKKLKKNYNNVVHIDQNYKEI